MHDDISQKSLSLMEEEVNKALKKGAEDLKILYFKFALMLETNDVGVDHLHFDTYEPDQYSTPCLVINGESIYEYRHIQREELANVFSDLKLDDVLKIIQDCNFILESIFFDKLKNQYKASSLGLTFRDSEVKFENTDLTQEFKLYKANLKREELENELSGSNSKQENKKLKL